MRLRKKMLVLVLIICALCSISAGAEEYNISEIKLENIVAPNDFGVCTLDSCDS